MDYALPFNRRFVRIFLRSRLIPHRILLPSVIDDKTPHAHHQPPRTQLH